MKPLTAALCIATIAALVVATCGCTESSNSSENATQTAGPTLEANSLADAINKKYTDQGYEVVNPFLKGETAQLIAYSGTVYSSAFDYTYHITITLVRDGRIAQQNFNTKISDAQARGFEKYASGSDASGSYWVGYYQGLYKDFHTPRIRIDFYYATDYGLILPNPSPLTDSPLYITNADVGHFYQITTIEQEYGPSS
ncbi:MAG: hypothetical protein ACXV5I_06510 [Halobacteriota archaeon]